MKYILTILLLITILFCNGQDYEIVYNPKFEESFTKENIDSLEVQINKLRHPEDTIFYQISEWTMVIIYPNNKAIKEDE